MADELDDALDAAGPDRRSFLKKLAIGTAFTAPVVSSFTMTGIKAVYAQTPTVSGGGVQGNQVQQSSTTSSSTSTSTTSTSTSTTTTTLAPNQVVN
jgi:hypothetical protein